MSWLVMHATAKDIALVRDWVNDSPDVAWIVKAAQSGCTYTWRAVPRVETLAEQQYAIWHTQTGPLNIPSGEVDTPDLLVPDPFQGWTQTLDQTNATAPWFGDNLPGPYSLQFRESGKEQLNSLGRSEFYWALDRFKSIGKPAHPEARRWWQQLRRFVEQSSTKTPLPDSSGRFSTFVFPEALQQHRAGRHLDVNP
ncbi:hypothetical protein [Luteimonas terricola]|uniref:Uncharacterized protein n=1 Tax=Luteimonas terricola TaxID=645597 RepID=A0ABQ2EMH7_9GAMM|nr:hypothetical protein [Luteimonas terricola]GGK17219.1 hypothetical protein GCM10011394_28020 [Luteimonas terricola]